MNTVGIGDSKSVEERVCVGERIGAGLSRGLLLRLCARLAFTDRALREGAQSLEVSVERLLIWVRTGAGKRDDERW